MSLLRVFLLLGSLAICARAQRPLNTTTNGTSVLTEPFFVKPTSILTKHQYPEQRGGGGVHDSPGIRNKERMPPLHPNSHLDIFVPPLNTVGGQQSTQQAPAPNNRLHKVQKGRLNKFSLIREMIKSSNSSNGIDHGGTDHHVIGKKVSIPERQIDNGQFDHTKIDSRPSSKGEAIQKIKDMQRAQENQHTPSPPSYNDDIDSEEKLGVKCTFEKQCAWTFDTNVTGPNFEVTTGVSLKESNVTGLLIDRFCECEHFS